MWGNGSQCGHGDKQDVASPEPVKFFENRRVQDFSCGGYHTVCFAVDKSGNQSIFSWGVGKMGELGNGDVKKIYLES